MSSNLNQAADSGNSEAKQGNRKPISMWLVLLAALTFLLTLWTIILPIVNCPREPPRRLICNSNLRTIAIALTNYATAHGEFPPAYTIDAQGRRLHSWRTLILPYLERHDLYEKIDFSKAWNDPANKEVYETNWRLFQCPSGHLAPGQTTYVAVMAENSCLRPAKGRRIDEISDGVSSTLLVVEVGADKSVHWMSPFDISADAWIAQNPTPHYPHTGGANAVFADCHTSFLGADVKPEIIRALITINANDRLNPRDYE